MKNLKTFKFITSIVVLGSAYVCFLMWDGMQQMQDAVPEIQAPESVMRVSVYDTENTLKQGATANDAEDGDLTNQIFVEKLSEFDEEGQRTVTYGVFDSSDNVSRATRKLEYTDYQAPKIGLNGPLIIDEYDYYGIQSLKEFVTAESALDGDISGQVVVERPEEVNDLYYVTVSVTDSCGIRSSQRLRVDLLESKPNFKIELTDYLIHVPVGTEIHPKDYIESLGMMGMDYADMLEEIEVRTDYNPNEPGTYEFIYSMDRKGGSFGLTKLVVVVEQE